MLTPLATVLSIGLIAVVVLGITWPLIRGLRPGRESNPEPEFVDPGISELTHLRRRRTSVLRMIQELDAERALGNMDEEDHRTQRMTYVSRAAALIREIEGRERVFDDEIEKAIESDRLRSGRERSGENRGRRRTG